jgi:hypothetical protein
LAEEGDALVEFHKHRALKQIQNASLSAAERVGVG